jgi:hypothetical protein
LGASGDELTVWYKNVLRYKFWLSGTVCGGVRGA